MAKVYLTHRSKSGKLAEFRADDDNKLYPFVWSIETALTETEHGYTTLINGETRYVDKKLPLEVYRIPKGAMELSQREIIEYCHTLVQCYVGKEDTHE